MNSEIFTTIAQQHLGVDTLKAQGSDSLDFHSVGVWGIQAALTAAYLAGYAAAMRATDGSAADVLPTERHTMLGSVWLGEGEAAEWSSDPRAETVVTAPIPEVALTANRWAEAKACDVLIPTAIRQRRLA
ncbi:MULTISPECIES: DUF6900 domain-containing protein [Lysobacter]|uniref:DUF6900 domain-containing protein n=1 Tax=Lysobacter TaxID=68 RepID=UPI001F388B7A|nr:MULTISPECIES: hypothetical protein [Lysobacter]UJB19266.1 hypothetical protein L1A79_23625 [Lysobacter capsici]UJQ27009.1 hypothetical protein L2D09_16260 [Lysobacter gummosus]